MVTGENQLPLSGINNSFLSTSYLIPELAKQFQKFNPFDGKNSKLKLSIINKR